MAQISKVERQTEIKSPAVKYFDIFASKAYLLPEICPEKVKSIQVIEGDWKTVGSVKLWTYDIGNCEFIKETVEAIDEHNKSVTFNVSHGEIMKYYNVFKSIVQVSTKGHEGSLVKWTVEYEKKNEDIPEPTKYLDMAAATSSSRPKTKEQIFWKYYHIINDVIKIWKKL